MAIKIKAIKTTPPPPQPKPPILEPSDAPLIVWLKDNGISIREIAKKFEVSPQTIRRVIAGTHACCRGNIHADL